jgi:hypothetical protein
MQVGRTLPPNPTVYDGEDRPRSTERSLRTREAAAVAMLTVAGWSAALWLSLHVHPDPTLSSVALFVHLASLVAGLGGVLAVDYFAVLWLLGCRDLRDVLTLGGGIAGLIWTGLAGLLASGALLSPDLADPLTRVKLGLVLMVALNGAMTIIVQQRLTEFGDHAPRSLLLQAAATTVISQAGWWGAAVVGFLNSQC